MKEYIFDRTTGEFIREQETHLDPLESKKQGKNVYLISATGTTTPPPEKKDGYAVIWNGTVWEQIEDHRGEIVWKSYGESMEIRELGPIPDGWAFDQPEKRLKWQTMTPPWKRTSPPPALNADIQHGSRTRISTAATNAGRRMRKTLLTSGIR